MTPPEKLFYSIGEAAQIVDVKPYVLRYWEGEFKKLNPQKSETGQRTYRVKDLQVALAIKRLLYEEKYTIAGAVQKLEELLSKGLPDLELPGTPMAGPSAEPQAHPALPDDRGTASNPSLDPHDPKLTDEFRHLLRESRVILLKNGL